MVYRFPGLFSAVPESLRIPRRVLRCHLTHPLAFRDTSYHTSHIEARGAAQMGTTGDCFKSRIMDYRGE